MNKTLTYGLIIGVVMVAIAFAQYSTAGAAGGLMWTLLGFAAGIGLLVYFGLKLRAGNGGFASFGKMFGWLMVMTIVSSVLQYIFIIIYMSTAGASAMSEASDAMSDAMNRSEMTVEEQQAADMVAGAMETGGGALIIGGLIVAFFIGLVIMAVINLILAAIIKKDPLTNASLDAK